MKRVRIALAVAGALAGLSLLVGACSGGGEEEKAARGDSSADVAATPEGGLVEAVPALTAVAEEAAPVEAPLRDPGADELAGAEGIDLAPLPDLGPKVIQTASLALSVEGGKFEETVDRARTIVAGLGGFVTSSSASQGPDERLVRGTLVVRVPGRAYAQAMSQLAKLGKVQAREELGQDVSQQYVDLEARQRHLEAVERQLLGFLDDTETVADALIVQDRLNQVQLQLEEVRGQLRYLEDQTSFATITLSVAERGAPVTGQDDGGWGITDAWRTAADGFLAVIGGVFVGLATAGPILAALAVAFLAGRWYVRRRREEKGAGAATAPTARPQA